MYTVYNVKEVVAEELEFFDTQEAAEKVGLKIYRDGENIEVCDETTGEIVSLVYNQRIYRLQ